MMSIETQSRLGRRGGLQIAAAALLGFAFLTLGVAGCDRDSPASPNILLIVVDTLRQDRLGCYGADRATSPNIDALAQQGIRFERAYATSPWTSPSVAAMFTGLYPSSHGLHTVRHLLRDDLDTLAELLRERGYATAGIVSHTLLGREFNFQQGFSYWNEDEAGGHDHVSTGGVTQRAIEQMQRLAHQPFFLFVHYFDPHHRYVAHPEHGLSGEPVGRITGEESIVELRALGETLTQGELQFLQGLYDEEIRHTDEGIGRLLARLSELGLDEETIVVFTADHGEAFLDHGWLGHTRDLYEELVRVPLIVRTAQALPGRTVANVVSLAALAPTLFDLAGLDREGLAFQASSLAPLVRAEAGGPSEPVLCEVDFDPIYERYREKRSHRKALVGQRFKLIRDDESGAVELYDLLADPQESRNVAAEHSSIALDFIEVIDRLVPELRSVAESPGEKHLTPEQIEQLRALGYVGR
jgi:arylsulfatase A-like enzyme